MILGKRDKKMVQDLQDTTVDYGETIERLDIKVKKKDNEVKALRATLDLLMDFDAIHEVVGIPYQTMARAMEISNSTLSKYRKHEIELTPTRYQELLFKLMNYLRLENAVD